MVEKLVDAKEIKKRWKKYMKELYRKDPNEPDYYDGVVSHPEPNNLESKVRWALGSTAVNKASGCNGIPVELFKIIRMIPSRCCIQLVSKSGIPSTGHRTRKS